MKRLITILTVAMTLGGNLFAQRNTQVTKTYKVDSFQSIELNAVGTIYLTQSDTYSLKIEGEEGEVNKLQIKQSNEKLTIQNQDSEKQFKKNKENMLTIHLTTPQLKSLDFNGVGKLELLNQWTLEQFKINFTGVGVLEIKKLKCQALDVNITGVGKGDVCVECEKLKASVDGIGGLTLSGKAKNASLSKSNFLGFLNTDKLKVEE